MQLVLEIIPPLDIFVLYRLQNSTTPRYISKKNFPWPVNTPDEQLQFRIYIHSRGVAVNS